MADDEDIPEEGETPEVKRVRPVTSAEEFEEVIKDPVHEKVVCAVWRIPGDAHSILADTWLQLVETDPALANVILLQCNPQELPDLAAQQELHAVPTVQYFWKGEKLFTFVGTNQVKFKAYLDKALKARLDELSIPKAWHRRGAPMKNMVKGEKYALADAGLEGPLNLTLALGWDIPAADPSVELQVVLVLAADGGKASNEQMLIRSDHPKSACGGVEILDAKTLGDDDVCVQLALEDLELEVWEVVVLLYIADAKEKEQNFVAVGEQLYLRLYDKETNKVLFKYDFEEDTFGENTGVLMGTLLREEDSWSFSCASENWELDMDEVKERFMSKEKKKKGKK